MAFDKMPIITKPNVDANGNPQLILVSNEQHEIFKNKIVLNGIPDKFNRVTITDEDDTIFVEKFDGDILSGNQFKVNYSNGVVTFPIELEGKSILANYYSKGIELVAAERIYTKLGDNGDVVETLDDKVAEMQLIKQNYDNATHVDLVRKVRLDYTATQNTTSFLIDADNYNPLVDIVWLYYKNTILLENKQYIITGTTVTLMDWTLLTGETIDIVVERAVKDLPPAGTNGGDIMNESIGENKLSVDVQTKLNKSVVIQDYKFTATQDNTTNFTISSDIFNPVVDLIDIHRNNLKLSKDVDYSLVGQVVNLTVSLSNGDFVEYRITKITGNSAILMPDGSIIQNQTIAKRKLTQDVQNEISNAITKATTNEQEILNAKKTKATLKDKIDEIDLGIESKSDKIYVDENFEDISTKLEFLDNLKARFVYGLKGDGTTDDTVALQNYINYCVANNKRVYLPAGRYLKNGKITIPTSPNYSFEMYGEGVGSVIIDNCLVDDGFVTTQTYLKTKIHDMTIELGGNKPNYNVFNFPNHYTSHFEHSSLLLNGKGYNIDNWFKYVNVWEGTFRNITFFSFHGNGVYINCPTENGGNIHFDRCDFIYSSSMFYLGGSSTNNNTKFTACKFIGIDNFPYYKRFPGGVTISSKQMIIDTGLTNINPYSAVVISNASTTELNFIQSYNSATGVLILRNEPKITYSTDTIVHVGKLAGCTSFNTPLIKFDNCHFENLSLFLRDSTGANFDSCIFTHASSSLSTFTHVFIAGNNSDGTRFRDCYMMDNTGGAIKSTLAYVVALNGLVNIPTVKFDGLYSYPINAVGTGAGNAILNALRVDSSYTISDIYINQYSQNEISTPQHFKNNWQCPMMLGNYSLWVSGDGKARLKSGMPTFDTDGTIIGLQS